MVTGNGPIYFEIDMQFKGMIGGFGSKISMLK